MKKILVLCFATSEVFVRSFPPNLETTEDWFDTYYNDTKLREKDCHYMVVDELKMNIA
jgi:hypothetical protein